MQDKHLFEYAVLRVVPKVEREEFLNVGVILYCKGLKYLGVCYHLDINRLCAFSGALDITEIGEFLRAFEVICRGGEEGGPIARLPLAERFRWLTATRSTIVQTSRVHSGFCIDPAETLEHLERQLVL
ncbi:DUF3037 domain-containing protein [Dinghuibacter silviterrae]|uniref:DUF3037 family protein n=1 Tax=Dinghuibacter silviterrae TaxID=1539049 RepID=A0A4R8DWD8_9BACT|nr:DUF3037 domain-containing protein [Dinghuibacter silviterrae]TDX02386.1 DUF3037 family protein [Dinghuibacter silviterrae]